MSLEPAKRLKGLGMKQESVFYSGADRCGNGNNITILSKSYLGHLTRRSFHDDTAADARTKCLIYLVENRIIMDETHRV